jgi:hypothetical protein
MIRQMLPTSWRPNLGAGSLGAFLLAGLLLGPGVAGLAAADPRDVPEYRDLQQTMRARGALLKDKALAPLNLGVRVHNRVATLWGPVPSKELKERAARVLRQVPDFLEVRNELHVEPPADQAPPQYLPERLPPSKQTSAGPGFPGEDEDWRGRFGRRTAELLRTASPSESVRLKPAVASGPEGGESVVLPAVAIPAPPERTPEMMLAQAVERLRQADRRYQGLRADVRGGEVCLSGTAAHWDDVHELARAVGRLPGVSRVVLEQIRASSAGR